MHIGEENTINSFTHCINKVFEAVCKQKMWWMNWRPNDKSRKRQEDIEKFSKLFHNNMKIRVKFKVKEIKNKEININKIDIALTIISNYALMNNFLFFIKFLIYSINFV
jgi:hypothetical protein